MSNFERYETQLASILQDLDGDVPNFVKGIFAFLKKNNHVGMHDSKAMKKMLEDSFENNSDPVKMVPKESPKIEDALKNANASKNVNTSRNANASNVGKLQNANVPSKKKADRALLIGFPCEDCNVYYETLTETERGNVIQDCSRHRSTTPPPIESPTKGM